MHLIEKYATHILTYTVLCSIYATVSYQSLFWFFNLKEDLLWVGLLGLGTSIIPALFIRRIIWAASIHFLAIMSVYVGFISYLVVTQRWVRIQWSTFTGIITYAEFAVLTTVVLVSLRKHIIPHTSVNNKLVSDSPETDSARGQVAQAFEEQRSAQSSPVELKPDKSNSIGIIVILIVVIVSSILFVLR